MTKGICCLKNHHGYCMITGTASSRYPCTGLQDDCIYKSIALLKSQIKRHVSSVSSMAAAKLASGFNQTATLLIVGKRGRGKSNTAASIMESYAAKIAVLVDGNPWDAHPERYFGIDNVGIIDLADIVRCIKRLQEPSSMYGGFILDDMGGMLGARDFMSKKNKLLNTILQTVRTKRVFVIITIPDNEGLDKDPRENADYFITMEVPDFENKMAIGKSFIQDKQYRKGDVWHVYVRDTEKTAYIRHSFLSPSPEFSAIYEPKRTAMADKLFIENMTQIEELISSVDEKIDKQIGIKDDTSEKQNIFISQNEKAYHKVKQLLQDINPKKGKKYTITDACHKIRLPRTEYYRLNKILDPEDAQIEHDVNVLCNK